MSIIITDLCKTYDDNEVLKNVNITLKDNSIYCLMGASGIGKTTLLRIIMGLEHADSGSVSGIDTKSISCMFQEDRLIPYLSAVPDRPVGAFLDHIQGIIFIAHIAICTAVITLIVLSEDLFRFRRIVLKAHAMHPPFICFCLLDV